MINRLKEKTAKQILKEEAEARGIAIDDLTGPNRSRDICCPRQEIMARINRETKLNLSQIGALFNRDHTTVIHALKAVKQRKQRALSALTCSDRERAKLAAEIEASLPQATLGQLMAGARILSPGYAQRQNFHVIAPYLGLTKQEINQ